MVPPPMLSRPVPAARRGPGDLVRAVLQLARPQQWTKNVFVLAGLVFAGRFLDLGAILRVLGALAAFCLLSSAIYCLNDLLDREQDRLHPKKRLRPLAAGTLRPGEGVVAALVFGAGGLAVAAALGAPMLWVSLAYLALNVAYSLVLKHVPLWDALTVAGGFVLRAVAGTAVLGIAASPWLLVCTYLVALYLSLGKRWSDAVQLTEAQRDYRRSLRLYDPGLVRLFMQTTMSATIISYVLYAVDGPHRPWMILTLPFVIYGLFHYQHMVESRALGASPDAAIFQDRAFLLNGAVYGAAVLAILLFGGRAG
jgi:4-hydroxybenzoate polyprenyltransferase